MYISLAWFHNYLLGRVQRVRSENTTSKTLPVTKEVGQGFTLAPTLFSIYICNMVQSAWNSLIHLYAVYTVLYLTGPSMDSALDKLQQSFHNIQHVFSALNLGLKPSKTNVMFFCRKTSLCLFRVTTQEGKVLEMVTSYKYLGWTLPCPSHFTSQNFRPKSNQDWGFFFFFFSFSIQISLSFT